MSKRILLVEDEEDNLTLLVHILKFLLGQEQLYIAKDGQEAMRMAYQQRPDLILMDLSLPKLDGWEVARSLRADAAFRTTPIIALTAHAMSGDKERALEVGCTDYFPKPIDIDRFIPFIKPYLAETQKPTPPSQEAPQAVNLDPGVPATQASPTPEAGTPSSDSANQPIVRTPDVASSVSQPPASPLPTITTKPSDSRPVDTTKRLGED